MTIAETQPAAYAVFPLLADASTYEPCQWDLLAEPEKRAYWIDLFRGHFPKLLAEAMRDAEAAGLDLADAQQRADAARGQFERHLDEITHQPDSHSPLNILTICLERERVLRRTGFDDPYRLAKQVENESALKLLPRVLAELDRMPPAQLQSRIIHGVFAGNIFDLGATQTQAMFTDQRVDFYATLDKLRPRPWFIDDMAAWMRRLMSHAHRAAVLFVDNAGPDVVLGMIPLARELLRRGTDVILTSNSSPSLNDVTHVELERLVDQIAQIDEPFRRAIDEDRVELVPSGNGAPLIDLRRVSGKLAEAVQRRGVDLVVLEGMGRAVETNYTARMTCDCLKLAMIKDRGVAEGLGAKLYDLVMRFHSPDMGD
ncbi:MAG: DUF89 family protein [Phycisphaeraceae bacterium]|nr:DUF89 family protein [Phycisphaeraceae bacterium]